MYIYCFVLSEMDVILDELRKNNVDIDMTTLSYHIHQCLEQYKTMYEQMADLPVNLPEIFAETRVNNFGRAMAFLTLVYVMKDSKEVTRRAFSLVAMVFKDMDLTPFKIEDSFFRRIVSYVKRAFTS